mgnify:CR=1 FL=1
MNWMLTFKRLLGRFWHDLFENGEFLLGVEYLHSLYSKLVENQYLNWVNGLIAKDLSVEQDMQPFVVYLEADTTKEWYSLDKLFDPSSPASAEAFASNIVPSDAGTGWLTDSRDPIPDPVYMLDHVYGYSIMLIKGLDYDVHDGHFLFHVAPKDLGLRQIRVLDRNGMPKAYYKLFGYARKTVKVCDPVKGFESSWLNSCSGIVWDIHQNGATFYNMKQLLGAATDSVICEADGTVDKEPWQEQGWNCISVDGKAYMSMYPTTLHAGDTVKQGDVLFGSLRVWKGTETPSSADVPGIRVQTDAGELVALNQDDLEPYDMSGQLVLPLAGPTDNALAVENYKAICAANMSDQHCPYIQVPPEVNPYKFVTQTLRRGRSVTVKLANAGLDKLAAAIACLRKSCCASGIVNIYVTAETAEEDAESYYKPIVAIVAAGDTPPSPTEEGQQYFSLQTKLLHTAYRNSENDTLYWLTEDDYGKPIGSMPELYAVYLNQEDDNVYAWDGTAMQETTRTRAATINLSCFAADAGMLAIAVAETLKIKDASAEAEVLL